MMMFEKKSHMTLQRKMVLTFAFFLPLVVLLVGLVLMLWISRTTREGLIEKYVLIDKGVANEIQMMKGNDERLINGLTYGDMIQDALTEKPSDDINVRYKQFRDIQSVLNSSMSIGAMTGIYLAGENGVTFRSTTVMDVSKLYPEKWSPFYNDALHNPMNSHWYVAKSDVLADAKVGNYIYMTRAILTQDSMNHFVGVALARISYTRYMNTLKYAIASTKEYAFILDGDHNVLAHSLDQNAPGKPPDALILKYIQQGKNVMEAKDLGGVLLYTKPSGMDWSVVHFVPDAVLRQVPTNTYTFIWIVMIVSFVIMLLGLSLFARTITEPIHRLTLALHRFGEGHLDERIPSGKRKDEIGILERQFNMMAEESTKYMRLMEENHKQQAKLELSILENQINPHFLYNVLDLINWKANRAGQKDISEMAVYLARFFRLGLHMGDEYVTVKDEAEHAKMYLLICKMRYGDSFSFDIFVEPELLRYKIKKIILQPVLENCIKYGLRPNTQDNHLVIRIEAPATDDAGKEPSQGRLLLTVADNGPGMTRERLAAVRERMKRNADEEETGSFGLHNLYSRLAFAYSDSFTFDIDSVDGSGTTVTIGIPYHT